MSGSIGSWLSSTFGLANRATVESDVLNKLTFGIIPAQATYNFITGGSAVGAPRFIGPVLPAGSSLGAQARKPNTINPVLLGASLLGAAALGAGAGFIGGRLTAGKKTTTSRAKGKRRRPAPRGFLEKRIYPSRKKARSKSRSAPRRMTALQRKYFGKGHKKVARKAA